MPDFLLPLRKFLALLLLALWALAPASAFAQVELSFYSKELGVTFPHAFVTLKGRLDSTGETVDESFGFTAKAVTPAILMGSVAGEVIQEKDSYLRQGDRQFSLTLGDAEYAQVMAVVERWRNRAQPSYNLDQRNCIHFVAEIAEAVGLKVDYVKALMKKPRSFLIAVRKANETQLAARQGHVTGAP